ncbi:MAG: helix-turn-helix domain-containing protein [Phenylobacterium sp.]|uniref:helix-turn-helix domain-containing protein n=1 Tax=Phenylobacterium sp. TaxID=1871053 RepID=UPI002717320D|nr:helix-turn-helix domain-containing protein [Phenylobacterium sp.]MDO9246768.1 helix-turn-helix domain-containing protein [Phenylobacterium sp.]MDP3871018.1 helix-turn-helix domain-containing protein [Phenylobacterium sp.]HQT55052.1 helix-turn-helix domain-containing protein [Phenylobacterium sp.]
MDIRALHNEADYDWALSEVAQYFEAQPAKGSAQADRFDVLSDLIEAYERRRWPIEPAEPLDAIRFAMDLKGLTQTDLAQLLGSRSRASEVLNGRRSLTPAMMAKLHRQWGVPADSLLRALDAA